MPFSEHSSGADAIASSPTGVAQRLLCSPAPVVVLLVSFLALGLSAANRQSPTFDEGLYVAAGYSFWATGDYRLHPENGNWVMRWEALPVWLAGYKFPSLNSPNWQSAQAMPLADQFVYECGNDADRLMMRSRQMVAVLSAALGLLVYFWSRKLFGPYGGLISLTLYVSSPAVLSNGFLATSDMAVTLWFTAATWSIWNVLQRVSPWTIAASCFSLAGLFLAKFSAVIILPIGLLLLAARFVRGGPLTVALGRPIEIHGRIRQLPIFAAIGVVQILCVAIAIWATFGFRYAMLAPPERRALQFQKGDGGFSETAVRYARIHQLLPEAYLYGFHFISTHTQSRNSFLNGQFSDVGFRSFFPYCVGVKTPLSLFVILLLAGSITISRARSGAAESGAGPPAGFALLYETTPLFVLFGVYWAFALASHINLGLRYILPTYPPMFILAGAAGLWFRSGGAGTTRPIRALGRRLMRGAIVVALAIQVAEAAWCWPHYLAYFNVLAGGPENGYRHLVDSSLDWGQDLKGLKAWLDNDPQAAADPSRVYLSYFGTSRPDYYQIQAQPLWSFGPIGWEPDTLKPPAGGVYCVSATMLQNVYSIFPGRWNSAYEETYQQLRAEVDNATKAGDEAAWSHPPIRSFLASPVATNEALHHLRLGRLCAMLRAREPDDNVGYSILIYRLSDDDVDRALTGPPAELLPAPETSD